jgi:8-oxo-dGTP diphosphatase
MSEPAKITHVAAGVIIRPDGSFLLAQRPEGKPYPGYWEFPGGKIEPDETPAQAISRELKEELNINVHEATPWIVRKHVYTHATVLLRFFRITKWSGEPQGLEGQAFTWQQIHQLDVAPMLPANAPIFRGLQTPTTMLISNIAEEGEDAWFSRAEDWLTECDRECGIDLVAGPAARAFVQIREKAANVEWLKAWLQRAQRQLVPHGAIVLQNAENAPVQASDGTHLPHESLLRFQLNSHTRPSWLTAACHDSESIALAQSLNVDALTLSPVALTTSHPRGQPLGWGNFSSLLDTCSIPAFALGGVREADRLTAYQHGAHGIAMMRSYHR